jgi:hypothetical protein
MAIIAFFKICSFYALKVRTRWYCIDDSSQYKRTTGTDAEANRIARFTGTVR